MGRSECEVVHTFEPVRRWISRNPGRIALHVGSAISATRSSERTICLTPRAAPSISIGVKTNWKHRPTKNRPVAQTERGGERHAWEGVVLRGVVEAQDVPLAAPVAPPSTTGVPAEADTPVGKGGEYRAWRSASAGHPQLIQAEVSARPALHHHLQGVQARCLGDDRGTHRLVLEGDGVAAR